MNDYRSRLSANAEFDDPRFWRFERNSRLPRGSFDTDHTERIVFSVCAVLFVVMLALVTIYRY